MEDQSTTEVIAEKPVQGEKPIGTGFPEKIDLSTIKIKGKSVAPEVSNANEAEVEKKEVKEVVDNASKPASETGKDESAASQPADKEKLPAEQFWTKEELTSLASQATNGEYDSIDSLYKKVKELESVKQPDPLEAVSPFIKGLIEWEKSGLDPRQYAELQSLDFSKMEAKEVLKQKYLKDNADLAKADPAKANRMFEFEYKTSYGALHDGSLDPDADQEKIQFLQDKQDVEKGKAAKELSDFQKANSIAPKKVEDASQAEANKAFIESHVKQVGERMKTLNGFDIPTGDKPEDVFKFSLEPEVKAKVQDWLEDPMGKFFLQELSDGKGNIDFDKTELLFTFAADPEAYNKKLVDHGYSKGVAANVIKKKNPSTVQTNAANTGGEGKSLEHEIAEGFQAKMKSKRN